MAEDLSISDVARVFGLRTSAIRYYEQIGILPSPMRKNGQRRYNKSALSRLAVVQRARETGFTLEEIRELPDGYELELPANNKTYQLLTEWAFQERLCCPFFDIALRFDRENGPLWLRLTGRPGTKEFIKMELGI